MFNGKDIAIAWSDLTFKVGPGFVQKEKTILNRLYGSVEFGAITALMGPSGAGKTTLLKCLNGKLNSGLCPKSRIMVNNKVPIISTFVGQHAKEQLILCLTVKQNLIYASKLKNSREDNTDHEMNAKNIMNELMLEDIWDNRVDNCSGGQQKRLTIAIEMTPIVKPNVLCIDEPTTGLDSNIAEVVMNCLQNLSESHSIAVIASIHQPNYEIVMMFTKVYVLAKGGHCLYCGTPNGIEPFLEKCCVTCNEDVVPVEELLKLASVEEHNDLTEQMITKTSNCLCFNNRNLETQMKICPKGLEFESKPFVLLDFWYLISRFISQIRAHQWKVYFGQLIFYIMFPIIASSMFGQHMAESNGCFEFGKSKTCAKDIEDDEKIMQNQTYLFFIFGIVQFIHISYVTVSALNDNKLFLKEYNNGWYSTLSYYIAKITIDIFPTTIFSAIFGFLAYYASGQLFEAYRLVGYIIVIVLCFLCAEGWGQIIGILFTEHESLAVPTAVAVQASLAQLMNFYIKIQDLPLVLQYVSDFASFPRFYYDSARILIYGFNRCLSTEKQVILVKYFLDDSQLNGILLKCVIYILVTKLLFLILLYLKTSFVMNQINLGNLVCKVRKGDKDSPKIKTSNGNGVEIRKLQIMDEIQVWPGTNYEEGKEYFKNICIGFTNLSLKMPKTLFNEEKVIINKINGYFEFSSLNALMGCSGAGKTSLLKTVNGLYGNRVTRDSKIFLSKFRPIKTCFVTQDERDHIMTGITAGEAMTYASKLKNSDQSVDHKTNVEEIMKELMIFNTFDTLVDKCSGGEQKRLVIAMELTAKTNKPNLLCIDEPTSGLDSYASQVVMQCLRRLSLSHEMCIITSIHQPSSDILSMFDKVFVLSRGGHCIYSDRPLYLNQYLIECEALISKNQLPIEAILKYSCYSPEHPIVQSMITRTSVIEIKDINNRIDNETDSSLNGIRLLRKRFFFYDLILLLRRRLSKIMGEEWRSLAFQSCFYLSFPLALRWIFSQDIGRPSGCIELEDDFNNSCTKTETTLRDEELLNYNINYNFFGLLVVLLFIFLMPTLTFAADLTLFFNEHRNSWYSTGVYYWSRTVIDFIHIIPTLLLYSYFFDIYEPSIFIWYFIFTTISCLNVQGMGQTIGILFSENQRKSVFVGIASFLVIFLLSNFVVKEKNLHYALNAINKYNPTKMALECILLVQYGFDRCNDRQFSLPLYFFDIEDSDFYANSRRLFIQFIATRIIPMIVLLLKVNQVFDGNKEKKRSEIVENSLRRKSMFI